MALDPKEKQKAYRDRMHAAGMSPLHDWVPSESIALVRDIIRTLRETAPQRRAKEEEKKTETK